MATTVPPGARSKIVKAIREIIVLSDGKVVKKIDVTAPPRKPRKPRKPKRPPHNMDAAVTRGGKPVGPPKKYTSGSMTPEQKKLGFPRGPLASHTEAKAMNDLPSGLGKGDKVDLKGEYAPCPSCKGKMNKAVRDNPGVEIVYTWPPNNRWVANGGARRR